MHKLLIVLTLGLFFFFGCSSSEVEKGEALEEISGDNLKPSDLIRNEYTESGPVDTTNIAKIRFDEPVFDFGTVAEGEKVTHTYTFVNTGNKPLVVSDARASCGCTVPEKPKEPIAPGKTGEIKVTFNSEGRPGTVRKTVTVVANTYPPETQVKLVGFVE